MDGDENHFISYQLFFSGILFCSVAQDILVQILML